jgi:hypothetical protein
MRKVGFRTRTAVIVTALAGVGTLALHPAVAEDSGFWDVIRATRPAIRLVAPAPGFSVVAPSPQIVRLPAAAPKATTPPDPAKRENPLAALLRDPTLRYGDIVMFPDGPRVFRGGYGGNHKVHDFVSLAASKEVSPAARKVLAAMPVGENNAWSKDVNLRVETVARRFQDVETTGSLGKTVTVRTGRGDVRIVRVPE